MEVLKVKLRGSIVDMAQLCSQSDPRKQQRSLKEKKRRIERDSAPGRRC